MPKEKKVKQPKTKAAAPEVETIGAQVAADRLNLSKRYVVSLFLAGRIVGAKQLVGPRGDWCVDVAKGSAPVIHPPLRRRNLTRV